MPAEHAAPVPPAADVVGGVDHRKLGMWFFLASEVIFFSALISAYTVYHLDVGRPDVLDVTIVAVNTFLLLCSSYTMVRALLAVQEDDRAGFRNFMIATIVLGALFVTIQGYEYTQILTEHAAQAAPSAGVFGATFFGLTGFHGLHVIMGVIWLIIILIKGLAGTYHSGNYVPVEIAALYWHFVDLVWVMLFTLIYLIP